MNVFTATRNALLEGVSRCILFPVRHFLKGYYEGFSENDVRLV